MSNVFSGVCTVGRDAEVKQTQSGMTVLNVTCANNVGFGDNQKTNWIRVALFGKRAEGQLKDYLKKGQQVFISGEMTTSEFNKNDGTKGFMIEVNANTIDLVGKRDAPSQQPQQAPVQTYAPQPQQPIGNPYDAHRQAVAQHAQAQPAYDSDVPF